jgi:hypothetical protein
LKETRFFWQGDYELDGQGRSHGADDNYNDLFPKCKDHQIKLEATPDYLYSSRTADTISNFDGEVRLVFILRDPIDRLRSWYKYASMNGLITEKVNLNEFIKMQITEEVDSTPQYLRALKHGVYSYYLKEYYKKFNQEKILIVFYEDLQQNPQKLCQDICDFASIKKDYFSDYDFQVHNRSTPVRSLKLHQIFRSTRRGLRSLIHKLPQASHKRFKFAGNKMASWYQKVNEKNETFALGELEEDTITTLKSMYSGEANKIKDLCGRMPQWSFGNSS